MMTLDELEAAWNAQADQHNQWCELGLDEKIAFAQEIEREACAKECEAEAARWRDLQDVRDFRLCAARIRARQHAAGVAECSR